MKLFYSPYFSKRFQNLPGKIQIKFKERLKLFLKNPFHPLLKNHQLKGDMMGRKAFSVTGDYRAIYQVIDKEAIKFVDIGTHPQVY